MTQLDPSFGENGLTIVDVGGAPHEDEPFTLVMTSDGKFVTPGKAFSTESRDFDFAILRFDSNGRLDDSFSGDGVALVDLGGHEEALGLVQQQDGKLVVGGLTRSPQGAEDFALVRLEEDGSLDPSFGTEGKVVTDFAGGNDQMLALALQSDGKVVAAGFTVGRSQDFALARYNADDGTLDPSFGAGGKVTTDFSGSDDFIFRLAIQPDDKVVAVGGASKARSRDAEPDSDELASLISRGDDFAIARYNGDGTLDRSFGSSGKATKDFFGGGDHAYTALVQSDGGVLAAGLAYNPTTESNDAVLVRYNSDGTLDSRFGADDTPGAVTVDFFGDYDQILALAVQPDGKILTAGHAKHPERSFEFAFLRFSEDGRLDGSFGAEGRYSMDVFGAADGLHGVALQSDGKVVAVGDAYNPSTGSDDFVILRLLIADPTSSGG